MEDHKSVLEFKNYIVEKLSYIYNDNFNPDENEELHMSFDINATIFNNGEDDFVKLDGIIGDAEDKNCPFIIEVTITGVFGFSGKEHDKGNFLSTSAVAVLFPYLRSLVSDLSGKSNIFPQFKLPLINIISYLKDEDRIEFLGNINE